MIPTIFVVVLIACTSSLSSASPARRELKVPELNITSPAEINELEKNGFEGPVIASGVEETVKEVEDLIKADPSLPRLTRGEILDIIDNITKTDAEKEYEEKKRQQKAIMLVMPYSPDSAQNGDVQALYTMPPVTHIVGDVPKVSEEKPKKKYNKKPVDYYVPETTKSHKEISTTTQTVVEIITEKVTPKPEISTYKPFKPLRRRTTKSPIRFTNHKYEDEPLIVKSTSIPKEVFTYRPTTFRPVLSNLGINIINPPSLNTKSTEKNSITKAPTQRTTTKSPVVRSRSTTPTSLKLEQTTPAALLGDMQLPDDFKDVLKNLDILIKEDPKYSSQYDSVTPFQPKLPKPTQENVHDILASVHGYQPTTTSAPDLQNVANNLSPDMKELLMNFGLIPDPNKKEPETQPVVETPVQPSSEINPASYSSFKPLPESIVGSNEEGMDDFLARFGLGRKSQRSQKAISLTKSQNEIKKPYFDAVPDHLKGVLADIGLTYKNMKEIDGEKKIEKQHVFSPSDAQFATEDELNKLNKLAGVIKQLEKLNGSVTDEDLKHIDVEGLKELVGSFNVPLHEQKGPNPIDFDSGVDKNEFKRQQSTTTSTVRTTNNPSLKDLEASFGGSSETATEVVTTTTEAPRRTGFYYLVDWNTFFDIDNQKGKRVNLRFQPTIGDPKRFLSVSVP